MHKAEKMGELFFDEVATKYGLPCQIISDRESKYTSDFSTIEPSRTRVNRIHACIHHVFDRRAPLGHEVQQLPCPHKSEIGLP